MREREKGETLLAGGELTYEGRSVSQVKTGFLHLGCPYCCEISLRVFLPGAAQSDLGGREGGREAPAALDLVSLTVLENGAKYRASVVRQTARLPLQHLSLGGNHSPTWSKPLRMFFLRKLLETRAGPAALRNPCGSRPLATRRETRSVWCDARGPRGLCSQTPAPLPGPVSGPLPHRAMKRVGTINCHPVKNVHF